MAKLNKSFCKLDKKDVKEHIDDIMPLVAQPRFVCRKCARAAASRKNLCKPLALPQGLTRPADVSAPAMQPLDA